MKSLRLIQNYLSNRKQRTKINLTYSSWEQILFGIPQGSILGLLLFKIFLCDLFFVLSDVEFASLADDNTPYAVRTNIDVVIVALEDIYKQLF